MRAVAWFLVVICMNIQMCNFQLFFYGNIGLNIGFYGACKHKHMHTIINTPTQTQAPFLVS